MERERLSIVRKCYRRRRWRPRREAGLEGGWIGRGGGSPGVAAPVESGGRRVIKSIPSKGRAMDGTVSVGKYTGGDLGLEASPDQGVASMGGEEPVHGCPGSGVPSRVLPVFCRRLAV